jgi:putative effector of murein hydrolase LrgA (UPF0299 family)
MLLLLAILVLLLVAGPLRRSMLANWRFFLPAAMGFFFAIILIRSVLKMNLPGFFVLGISLFMAMEAGVIGLQWFNDTFGPRKQQ